jgi:hypothetical protein
VRRRVRIAWALLVFNTMTFTPGISILHLPSKVGKGIAQGALPLALLVLLSVNPRIKFRPNVMLCLISLLIADAAITAMAIPHLGTAFRTFRLAEFVAALWLLTPWWGRRDMLLLRCHLRCLYVAVVSVLLGVLIAPGHARAYDGRLVGVIWPMLPTQIAQYAAIAAGLTMVLWLGRMLSGRLTLLGVAAATPVLVLTHTRTALVGMIAGILVAGISLFTRSARVRRVFAAGTVLATTTILTLAGVLTTWLARGENEQGLSTLSGRTNFWALVLSTPRTKFQEILGFGLSNASVNGLPIDSTWLAAYMQEGLFGVVVCAAVLLFLLITAFFQPPGAPRAIALFLVTYCMLASITEDTFDNASTYLLDLTAAASLLVLASWAGARFALTANEHRVIAWDRREALTPAAWRPDE